MKKQHFKGVLASTLALSILLSPALYVRSSAAAPTENLKDHWSFEGDTPLVSTVQDGATATLQGEHVSVVDSGNPVFGKVLRFGEGTDNYMRLESYINTGSGSTSFSMWYRYDTSITGDVAAAPTVLLQHEGSGRSLLTLQADGKYNTYINGQDVTSTSSVTKGGWQHITVTFDQDAKKVKYYINGELDSQQDLGGTAVNQVLTLRLGAHKTANTTNPHPMRGDVDEFYVYNKALTDDEAKAIYEDKAGELYEVEIQTLIQEAQTLYDSQQLEDTHQYAVALSQAIEAAKKAESLAQLQSAYTALEQAMDNYRSALPLSLMVDLNQVDITIDPNSIFGINHRYGFNGYGTFNSETMQMNEEFVELYKQAGFGSIRYPGGSISNLFNWKATLGPVAERKNQIHGYYNNAGQGGIAPNFGIGEIADFADQVDSEIVYVYSLARGSAQDAADLVEYLNAEVGTNPNGGIDWAKVRADNGHPEPYNVRYFEIGNEMQMAYGPNADGTTSQGYWTDYVDGDRVNAYTEGGTAKFTQRYTVKEEDWNKVASQSDGTANQVRFLRYANLNPGILDENGKIVDAPDFKAVNDGVQVYVGTDGNLTEWTVVESLAGYDGDDQVCVVNYANGSIQFGDGTHGAIPAKGQNIYATYTVDREGFIDISKAIKNTTDQINAAEGSNHEAHVYTSFESANFITLMNNLDANEWYDGMTIHPYSGTVSGGTDVNLFYDNAMKKAEDTGIQKVRNYINMLPEGKVPVISEFGIYNNTQSQVRSQTHALYIAKVMMEYVKLGSPYIQKHCLSDWYSSGGDSLGPTQQAVIQVVPQEGASTLTGEGEFKYFSTPSAHVFQMFNSGFGDKVVSAQLDSAPTMSNGVTSLTTLASKDDQGNIYIALVNVDRETDRSVKLDVTGVDLIGYQMEIQTLASEGIADENTLEDPDNVTVVTTQAVSDAAAPVVSVPKHAFVVVKLSQPVNKADLTAAITQAEALNADDYTAESWANLQTALAAAKTVEGSTDATQTQVNEALTALQGAMKALVDAPAPSVDKSDLTATITEAEQLQEKDYTPESWANLQTALAAAKTVEGNADATQAQVNEALAALQSARKALVDAPAPSPSVEPSTEPTTQPTTEPTSEPTTQPTTQPTAQPTTQPTQPGDSVPPTGDSMTIWPAAAMLVLSLGGLVLAELRRRRG